jgi:hypothetical protein
MSSLRFIGRKATERCLLAEKPTGTALRIITTAWGNYKTNGAPVGVCKVTVDKYFEMPAPPKTMDEEPKWSPEQWDKYERDYHADIDKRRIIPKHLTESATTPFEITIVEKTGGMITIDVAK